MIGHVPEFGGHDAETVGHAPPKYAPTKPTQTSLPLHDNVRGPDYYH
jgi:hypothetical protein